MNIPHILWTRCQTFACGLKLGLCRSSAAMSPEKPPPLSVLASRLSCRRFISEETLGPFVLSQLTAAETRSANQLEHKRSSHELKPD